MNTRNIICAAMALFMSMPAMASNWRVRAVKEKEMKTITIEMRDAEAFSLIDLSVARQNPLYYEVIDGLQPGDRVITAGYDAFGEAEEIRIEDPL